MVELDEKTLTPAETKKKEEIVMSMKKKGDFFKYGKRAKEVMYATATKQAKKLAEADMPPPQQSTISSSEKRAQTQQKQKLLQILQQKERAVRTGMMDISASFEAEGEVLDERTKERKGQPRSPRNRAMEIMRSMPNYRQGGMTRSGKTIAQHEAGRGVKKTPGAPTPKGETTADRLARRKEQQASAAKRSQDMYKPRAGESD